MRKPISAGNWKMNKTLSEAQSFAEAVLIWPAFVATAISEIVESSVSPER